MQEKVFEVEGKQYKTIKLNAREQLGLVTKMGALYSVVFAHKGNKEKALDALGSFLFELDQSTIDKLLFQILAKTSVKLDGGTGWMPLVNDSRTDLMNEDLDLFDLLSVAKQVLEFNLGNFIEKARALMKSSAVKLKAAQ